MVGSVDIVVGSLTISVAHGLIPGHWLPIVAIARSAGWSHRHTVWITGLVGFAHVLGTILVGALAALIGHSIADQFDFVGTILAPGLLFGCGLYFVISGFRHAHHCRHHHTKLIGGGPEEHALLRKFGLVASLALAMFFSPCIEIISFFMSAGMSGGLEVATVSLIFLGVTVPLMMLLVSLAFRGVERFNWHLLDHHGRTITGLVLLVIGFLRLVVGD
jgi:nickel/cobalt exporter